MRICVRKFRKKYDRERLTQELKALGESLGRVPVTADISLGSRQGKCASLATYQAEFGTISQALKVVGLKAVIERRGKPRTLTQEELIEELISLRLKLGRRVGAEDVKKAHRESKFPSVSAFKTRFGAVDIALIKAERIFRERSEVGQSAQNGFSNENGKNSSN